MDVRRRRAATRNIPHPYDQGRSHGCFLPSSRLISSSEKKRQSISMPRTSRTSRIHFAVWYAHGHITSKWNPILVTVPG